MMTRNPHLRWLLLPSVVLCAYCGSEAAPPATAPSATAAAPAPAAASLSSVQVGVAGNAPATMAPGDTKQLFALAKYSDGSASDVTNVAIWQSSNPVVATVSAGGLLKAAADGVVDVMATYEKVPGTLHGEVRTVGCEGTTVSPATLSFSAFGTPAPSYYSESVGAQVRVTTPRSDCRWTVQSDSDWLRFQFDPRVSGSGSFSYTVPANNYPGRRTARLLLTVGGTQVAHTVTQEPPSSCSYVVKPEEAYFPTGAGIGTFDVVATPADCQWRVTVQDTSTVRQVSTTSGTGSAKVGYIVQTYYLYSYSVDIVVAGLSGANPPARHRIYIGPR